MTDMPPEQPELSPEFNRAAAKDDAPGAQDPTTTERTPADDQPVTTSAGGDQRGPGEVDPTGDEPARKGGDYDRLTPELTPPDSWFEAALGKEAPEESVWEPGPEAQDGASRARGRDRAALGDGGRGDGLDAGG